MVKFSIVNEAPRHKNALGKWMSSSKHF